MKKILALALSLCLLLAAVPAMAAGQLTVVQETYTPTIIGSSSLYGYVFAEVTNSGDAPIEIKNGVYEILGADGAVIKSSNVYRAYPSILAPGETGYIHEYQSISGQDSVSAIPGYTLTVSGTETNKAGMTYLPVTATVEEVNYWFDKAYMVTSTITNNTDATIYEPYLVFGIYDAAGKLLYSDNTTLGGLGIPAGSSLEVLSIADEFTEIWKANDTIPATVKVFCYMEK